MNKKDFDLLSRACDQVLMTAGLTIEKLSIPWLHVVRAHPVVNKIYINVFGSLRIKDIVDCILIYINSYLKLIFEGILSLRLLDVA